MQSVKGKIVEMPSTVLVVDPLAEYRSYIRKLLGGNPEYYIVGEADGIPAVQRAAEMQPDIIVLDMGLATLSDLNAICLLQEASPRSRILLMALEAAPELIREAFERGASAYVSKLYIADELESALRCVFGDVLFLGKYSAAEELAAVQ